MPPRKRKKGKKKKRKKAKKPKAIDPAQIAYEELLHTLESRAVFLQCKYKETKEEYNRVKERRNTIQSLYSKVSQSKDDVLKFLQNQLLYLVETKESMQSWKDKEKAKADIEAYNMEQCLSQLKESAEELGNKLAMDNMFITSKLAILDDFKIMRYKIVSGIQIMKHHLNEQFDIVPMQITTRTDHQFNIVAQLRTQVEDYVDKIRQEATNTYYLNSARDYKRCLRANMECRVIYVKYVESVFQLYKNFGDLQSTETKLLNEISFITSFKLKLKKELLRQQRKFVYLESEIEKLSRRCSALEVEVAKFEELKRKVHELRIEVEEMKDTNRNLESDISDARKFLQSEKQKLKMLYQKCSRIIFVLKTIENAVTTGGVFRDDRLDTQDVEKIESKLLAIVDTTGYEMYGKEYADSAKKMKASSVSGNLNHLKTKIKVHRIDKPTNALELRTSEMQILSEIGLLKANRRHDIRRKT